VPKAKENQKDAAEENRHENPERVKYVGRLTFTRGVGAKTPESQSREKKSDPATGKKKKRNMF